MTSARVSKRDPVAGASADYSLSGEVQSQPGMLSMGREETGGAGREGGRKGTIPTVDGAQRCVRKGQPAFLEQRRGSVALKAAMRSERT